MEVHGMSEASKIRLRFERFADAGEKHAFRLRSEKLKARFGSEFLGWVMEVGEDAVLAAFAPSPFYAQAAGTSEMAPPDEWVPFDAIEPSSLAYWDDATRRWVDFPEDDLGETPEAEPKTISGQR
jgi:hypothetical protein